MAQKAISNRAARRAAARRAPESTAPAAALRLAPAVLTALWWLVTGVALVFTAMSLSRKITWYLAVDQYGYLTFAHDLLHGRVFHDWPPLDSLRLPDRTDVLAQTYVFDHGKVYCRYSPGFPILLAAWLRLFGDDGAHYLNPTVFLALLAVLIAFGRRVSGSPWRGTIAAVLVTLFPTAIHLWALTLTRDLASHLAGFTGLFLLLPGRGRLPTPRIVAGGVALGFAATIRPDCIIYLVSGGLVLALGWWREGRGRGAAMRRAGWAALGVAIGLAPLLAYNWLATGSPIRNTQGMELEHFFDSGAPTTPAPPPAAPGVGYPSLGWHGGTSALVQGGGLRLENLRTVVPGIWAVMRSAYSDLFLAIAIWGAVLALVQRRRLFMTAVPYIVGAILFYGCWSKPDGRYLSGVFCFVPLLVVEGVFGSLDLVRRVARRATPDVARLVALGLAAALLCGAILVNVPLPGSALPPVVWLVSGLGITALVLAAAAPGWRVTSLLGPALGAALVVLAVARVVPTLDRWATFQGPAMRLARMTFARAVERNSVVITTEDVGRPAENIDYYSGVAHALYLTDLARWRLSVPIAAVQLTLGGWKTYLLIPTSQPGRAAMLQSLDPVFQVELVADIPAQQAIQYFVAAPFHRGIRMELHRLRLRPDFGIVPPSRS